MPTSNWRTDATLDVHVAAILALILVVLSGLGGFAIALVGTARAAASPAEQADCRRDRGVSVIAADGTIVCIERASVIWESARR